MPDSAVLISGAVALVVLVCLTLWIIAEAYRRPDMDGDESKPKR